MSAGTVVVLLGLAGAAGMTGTGPHGSQSPLDEAFTLLAEGQVEEGRTALLVVADGLAPSQSVGLVRLVRLLDRLGEEYASQGARAAGLAHAGQFDGAIDVLETSLSQVGDEHGPALLSLAARLADDAGEPEQAAGMRERLIRAYPEAPDRPEAILELAKHRRGTGQQVPETIALLEELIVEQPNHALVPAARRELERLRSSGV